MQIGMLQVLAEHGFVPDRIYGSSVGAVNGVALAGDPTREGVQRMTEIWQRADPARRSTPRAACTDPGSTCSNGIRSIVNTGLRKVIEEGIDFERLEEAVVPVEVVATSLTDGRERWFTCGPAVEAVLASSAVPAIFPPVEIDGERFIDGGVVEQCPHPSGHRGGSLTDRRAAVLSAGLHPGLAPASGRSHAQRPVDLHPRPIRRDMANCPRGWRSSSAAGAKAGPATSTTSRPPTS